MASIEFSGFDGCIQIAAIETNMAESAPLMWNWVCMGVSLNVVAEWIIRDMVKGLVAISECECRPIEGYHTCQRRPE